MFYILLLTPFILFYLFLGVNPLRLFRNYLSARTTNFPLLVSPTHPNHIPWTILSVPLRPLLRAYLPTSLFTRLNHTTYGFEFSEKFTTHARLGKSFLVVTSGNNELMVADPDLAMEILRRPKEFRQTLIGSRVMRIFGDNLITSDGEHWARQRRLIAGSVNEKISSMVWKEAREQTREMLEFYTTNNDSQGETDDYAEGLKNIAINVLGVAGYGVRRGWKESLSTSNSASTTNSLIATSDTHPPQKSEQAKTGFKLTYIEATRLAVDHIVEASLVPSWILLSSWMPKSIRQVGIAKQEFPAHTKGMLEQERARPSEKVNMLSMLVKESDVVAQSSTATSEKETTTVEEDGEGEGAGKKTAGLTEEEIMGNLFVFTAAGFDTTANTMGYAMTLLALYPEWQEWMMEEIDEVVAGRDGELEYNEVFPGLVRVLAVMYETMRIFPPVVHIAKGTATSLPAPGYIPLTHPVTGTVHRMPANTTIYINAVAVQSDPGIYGEDVDKFRPGRFVEESQTEIGDGNGEGGGENLKAEGGKALKRKIKSFGKGTYLAWSAGPRVCPGSKMSQVEFVSVFMTIFAKYRVELVLEEKQEEDGKGKGKGTKETIDEARRRVEAVMADSQSRLTLQMNRPRDVRVRFARR